MVIVMVMVVLVVVIVVLVTHDAVVVVDPTLSVIVFSSNSYDFGLFLVEKFLGGGVGRNFMKKYEKTLSGQQIFVNLPARL